MTFSTQIGKATPRLSVTFRARSKYSIVLFVTHLNLNHAGLAGGRLIAMLPFTIEINKSHMVAVVV